MNPVGKIIIVVQVLFSLFFMTFAAAVYTVQTNWKQKATEYQTAVGDAQQTLSNEREERKAQDQAYETQIKDQTDKANRFEGQNATLTQQVAQYEQDLNTVRTERDAFQERVAIATEESARRRDEALKQRVVNEDLRKKLDSEVAKSRGLEDQLFDMNLKTEEMQKTHGKVLADLASLKEVFERRGLDSDPTVYAGEITLAPAVEGLVSSVSKDKKGGVELVEVTVGSDDGLAKGHELFIYRQSGQGKYLGKIKLVYVATDKSVGRVIETAKNGIIERGDNVNSRL